MIGPSRTGRPLPGTRNDGSRVRPEGTHTMPAKRKTRKTTRTPQVTSRAATRPAKPSTPRLTAEERQLLELPLTAQQEHDLEGVGYSRLTPEERRLVRAKNASK
jgi:hypothetical protein